MKVIIYANGSSLAYRRLKRAVASAGMVHPPALYDHLDQFCRCLRSLSNHPDVVVLMPGSSNDLYRLYDMRTYFERLRSIVILPSHEETIITMGFKFRPRFITFCEDDFEAVTAILTHMQKRHQISQIGAPDKGDHTAADASNGR